MDAFHAQKSVGHCAPCVTARGYQYIDTIFPLFADEVLEQAGHEAGAYILERECRAVEQFEREDVFLHLYYGAVEGQCVVDNAAQVIGRYIFAEKDVGYVIGNLLESHFLDMLEE